MPNYSSYNYAHAYEMGKRVRLKDKKIGLVSVTDVIDPEGNSVEVYSLVAQVWAYVRQVDQTKRTNTAAPYSDEELMFYVNWRQDLATSDGESPIRFVTYCGRVLEITRVDTYEGYRRDLAIYAKSTGTSGPRYEDVEGM